MRTFPDIRMRSLMQQVSLINEKLETREYEAALNELLPLDGRLAQLGIPSGWVKWALAVALDMTDDVIGALDAVDQALTLDPLNSANHQSHGVIVNRLRTRLANSTEGDVEVPRLYARLLREEECDVNSHMVWARYLVHSGKHDSAAKVLEAVTLLAPASIDAWRARAQLERRLGHDLAAAECEAEAGLRSSQRVAFGIPVKESKS